MPGSTSTGYRASRRNADKLQSVDVEYSSESSLSFDSMPSTPQMDFTLSDNDEYKPHR
jgi:hypothetical protein